MIHIRTQDEIALMQASADISMKCMDAVAQHIRAGVTTRTLDQIVEDVIRSHGAEPSFKGYHGYPASINASINEEVVHGLPSRRKLRDGDIIGIDLGTLFKGYHSDMARTFMVGDVSPDKRKLVECVEQCFQAALKVMVPGNRLGDIGHAVQYTAERQGYGVVRVLCGHGIGRDLHEDPEVLNFGRIGRGIRLRAGMVLAVEPMINMGTHDVVQLSDGWTIVTADQQPSAHYENTVYISEQGPVILTEK